MKKQYLSLLLFLSISLSSLFSQNNGKVDKALSGFLNTAFMEKFQDVKIEAENKVRAFKKDLSDGIYDSNEEQELRTAYDKTARRFNKVLTDIKKDFLDRKKLKYITKYPDSYSKGLELEMYKLSDYYSQNFLQKWMDITGEDGSALLLILAEIIPLITDGVGYIKKIRQQSKKYTHEYLDAHLVEPNRFHLWDEISNDGAFDYPTEDAEYMEEEIEDGEMEEEMDELEGKSLKAKPTKGKTQSNIRRYRKSKIKKKNG